MSSTGALARKEPVDLKDDEFCLYMDGLDMDNVC